MGVQNVPQGKIPRAADWPTVLKNPLCRRGGGGGGGVGGFAGGVGGGWLVRSLVSGGGKRVGAVVKVFQRDLKGLLLDITSPQHSITLCEEE